MRHSPVLPEISIEEPPSAENLTAFVRFPGDCVWFDGHFPGNPVLPGVALLAAVRAVIGREYSLLGEPIQVTDMGRVRFRQVVAPNQILRLRVWPGDAPGVVRFSFTHNEARVCEGSARYRRASTAPSGVGMGSFDTAWRWR